MNESRLSTSLISFSYTLVDPEYHINGAHAFGCRLSVGGTPAALCALSLIRTSLSTHHEMDVLLQRLSSKIEEHNDAKGGVVTGDDGKNRLFTAENIADAAISLANEKMSLHVFVDLLNDALSADPTSYDFDKSLLNLHEQHEHRPSSGGSLEVSGQQVNVDHLHGMSHNKRNAVVCRLGEKKVLKHYIHMAETALRYISEVCEGSTVGTATDSSGDSENHGAMAEKEKEILAQYDALLAETLQSR